MYPQNYCMVDTQTNLCDNLTLWDGDPNTWTPPPNTLMLPQADTPAKIWVWDDQTKDWVLTAVMGQGQIGFVWDGMYLIAPNPKPPVPTTAVDQPTVDGAQTL